MSALVEKVKELQRMLLARATDMDGVDAARYSALRQELLLEPAVKDRLPECVHACRELDDFWPFIKEITGSGTGTWAKRRRYLADQFRSLLDALDAEAHGPARAIALSPADDATSVLRGAIDFAIITIKEEEYAAVLSQFPPSPARTVSLARSYDLRDVAQHNGTIAKIAITRCPTQGNGVSQDVFRDIVNDLDPQWVLCVGIAGGVPTSEFSLGDVLLGSNVLDMSVEAIKAGEPPAYALESHAAHTDVENYCTAVKGQGGALGNWGRLFENPFRSKRRRARKPPVAFQEKKLYGDKEWRSKTRESLKAHAKAEPRPPQVSAGLIAASDRLIKDARIVARWLRTARHIRAVEMESAGLYRAARGRGAYRKAYPAMAIRGISDIVGFKRQEAWTRYACISAAAFAYAFVRSGYVVPRSRKDTLSAFNDDKALAAMASLFDRPAFYTPFAEESSLPDFREAITATIKALATGVRHTRDGVLLERIPSRHDIQDPGVRAALGRVELMLAKLRTTFDKLLHAGNIAKCPCGNAECSTYVVKPEAVREMDRLRSQVLDAFTDIYPKFTRSLSAR
jgi:nucleoside phosphorylase